VTSRRGGKSPEGRLIKKEQGRIFTRYFPQRGKKRVPSTKRSHRRERENKSVTTMAGNISSVRVDKRKAAKEEEGYLPQLKDGQEIKNKLTSENPGQTSNRPLRGRLLKKDGEKGHGLGIHRVRR